MNHDHTYRTISSAAVLGLREVVRHGDPVAPRNQETYELLNYSATVTDPQQWPVAMNGRGLSSTIAALETLGLVGGTATSDELMERVPAFRKFSNHGILLGSYGQRVYGQVAAAVERILVDPETRQAVVDIHQPIDVVRVGQLDVPCTLTLQFIARNDGLHMRTSMRSNDAFLGLPYDLTQFVALGHAVAQSVSRHLASYHHTVGSFHVYKRDVEKATEVSLVATEPRLVGPMWGAVDFADISHRAREILRGRVLDNPTDTERWLWDVVNLEA